MSPRRRGTRWPVGNVVSARAATNFFALIRVIVITSVVAPSCRAASKAASQARWLAAPENQDYFRGPANVARVKAWRSHHPGYWRKRRRACVALQDLSSAQPIDFTNKTINFASPALQDLILAQPAVLIGLIAHIVGTPLQDEILRTTDRLLRLGQDILASSAARDCHDRA